MKLMTQQKPKKRPTTINRTQVPNEMVITAFRMKVIHDSRISNKKNINRINHPHTYLILDFNKRP